jgi:hypothetical protein
MAKIAGLWRKRNKSGARLREKSLLNSLLAGNFGTLSHLVIVVIA